MAFLDESGVARLWQHAVAKMETMTAADPDALKKSGDTMEGVLKFTPGVHYDTQLPETGEEGQIFFVEGDLDLSSLGGLEDKDNVIQTNHIADAAVSTNKLASGAVVNSKLANLAVNTGKIADGAITTEKIANFAITLANLATDVTAEALGGFTMKKLWTNAKPTSTFAPQKVSLTLTDYEHIGIIFRGYTEWDSYSNMYICRKTTQAQFMDFSGNQRTLLSVTDTGVQFSGGAASDGETNDACIPYIIYGIKGVN